MNSVERNLLSLIDPVKYGIKDCKNVTTYNFESLFSVWFGCSQVARIAFIANLNEFFK